MHVTVPMDRDYHAKVKAFGKERGFPSTAQLMRTAVDDYMKGDDTSMIKKQFLPLLDMLKTIAESNRQTQEFIELLDMRLQMKEGHSSVVLAAAREIKDFLLTGEKDLSTILTKLKPYDRETKFAALVLLLGLNDIGSYRKKSGDIDEKDKEE
jgi:hypothetical protein